MKSVVNFYSIEINHDIKLCLCKFVKCLYKKDENIIIIDDYEKLEELDKKYPDSLFILNTRSFDKWILSRLKHGYHMS